MGNMLERAISKVVAARPEELKALLWSFCYFFFLLASYFILRPLRDEMGAAAGRDFLQWLFTATFFVMLLVAPIYAAAVARLPRRRFIPLVYRFFIFNLAIFWLLLQNDSWRVETARVFFVWVSVFNLFAVSVFWSFMADLYRTEQSKRLFGFIAAGGTAGTLLGSAVTVSLAGALGPVNLLLVAAALLELAVFCAIRLERAAPQRPAQEGAAAGQQSGTGGGLFDGFLMISRSPYLAGLAGWVALLSLAGPFLYFIQIDVVRAASPDPATRTRIFAGMDMAANLLTLALQFLATGRIVKRIGAGPSAAILPLVFGMGFVALAIAPALAVIVVFQVAQRVGNFAFSNPAREIFFTSVAVDEKYKAKNLIDTAVLRGGDVAFSWLFTGLRALGLGMTGVAMVAVPLMALWAGIALALGRAQERRQAATNTEQERAKGA
ncbi:MAG: MFS transporter [Beijerinckiaceae bacterium]|nr:MFS transporter [Beijerinckiaceae bacterium]